MPYKCDTNTQVFFYEQEFYILSNFAAFDLVWKGLHFPTSEHAYHWEKFPDRTLLRIEIQNARSAHGALKLATEKRHLRRSDWDIVKTHIMKHILTEKASQHEYVRRKLLETGNRELVEDSWRDDFWGWGPNKDGENVMGKLWMEIRAELQGKEP